MYSRKHLSGLCRQIKQTLRCSTVVRPSTTDRQFCNTLTYVLLRCALRKSVCVRFLLRTICIGRGDYGGADHCRGGYRGYHRGGVTPIPPSHMDPGARACTRSVKMKSLTLTPCVECAILFRTTHDVPVDVLHFNGGIRALMPGSMLDGCDGAILPSASRGFRPCNIWARGVATTIHSQYSFPHCKYMEASMVVVETSSK